MPSKPPVPDDTALFDDIRLLGRMLGDVIREQEGQAMFDTVEQVRQLAVRFHREGDARQRRMLGRLLEGLSRDQAVSVIRAFSYFSILANLAEDRHVLRRRQAHELASERPQPGSVRAALDKLRRAEVSPEQLEEFFARSLIAPVLTAHPTEVQRKSLLDAEREIARLLAERDAPMAPRRRRQLDAELQARITQVWQTRLLRYTKLRVSDEIKNALSYYGSTFFQEVPRLYLDLEQDLDELFPRADGKPWRLPSFFRMGTWVGGDRDGNPFVTAKVTKRAAGIASEHVLRGLERASARIGRGLTLDAATTPPTPALTALTERLLSADDEGAADVVKRSPGEPHRQAVLLIARKITATRERDADLAYADPEHLLADLLTVQSSLVAAGAPRQAYGHLQQLVWQVQTFGFHLAELEVRQHSAVHAKVLAELDAGGERSELTEEVLEVYRTISYVQKRFGPRAAGRYIVSFTRSADDLAAVHRLARYAVGPDGTPPVLDVIPLFETFADLQAAPAILAEIVEHPAFAARLADTGRRLEVMLGYSDSSKDVGPVAANLALYEAQAQIADWAQRSEIELTLFHGRGGALGRGGGPANSAILAQPPHSVDGRFKLTEQGEVIFARYGDPAIAMRHIDQVAAAILTASAPSNEQRNRAAAERFADVAQRMEDASRARFFELVKAPGFAPWFATVTPMEEVGLLALGSRPARRGLSVESLEDLRAIPWVFAWTQARINLAGWFGLGTALETVGDLELLQEAYREWPLLRAMIDNVAMSLAKADDRIARRYLELGDRDDLAQLVIDEMALTRSWVVRIAGGDGLLSNKPVLQRAVKLRSPYVDALSLLQLRALRALRDAPDEVPADPELQRLLLLSVSGVAAGLQNTG